MDLRFPSVAELTDKIAFAARRFPLAMISAVAGVGLMFWLIEHNKSEDDPEGTARLTFVAALGLPLFVGLAVFSEKKGHLMGLKWAMQALGAAILMGCWWLLDPFDGFQEIKLLVWYVGLSFLFHLLVSFAAYLDRDSSTVDFWEFNKQLCVNFLSGALYSGVILVGLLIALLAANSLFDLSVRGETYAKLWTLVFGLFQTVYFLSNFPRDFQFDHDEIRFETVVKNLVKWILIPISILYFFILYAYSGKILISMHLPKGWVSSLMVGFSVAGIFTWLMNFMLPRLDNAGIISWFKKWFWPILTPMLILLFIAVGRRVSEYGLTEDRYLIAHLGVWLTLMAAYFIFSKKDDIRVIPISLAIFSIIYLMPGIGGMDAGVRAQTKILAGLLEKNGLLKDGKSVPQDSIYKGDDVARMNDLVHYLTERDAVGPIAGWLGKPVSELKKDSTKWELSGTLKHALGISENYAKDGYTDFASLYRQNSNPVKSVSISGFDSLYQCDRSRGGGDTASIFYILEDGRSVVFDGKTTMIQPVLDDLWGKQHENSTLIDSLDHLDFAGNKMSGRLLLNNINIRKSDAGLQMESVNGWLLMKKN